MASQRIRLSLFAICAVLLMSTAHAQVFTHQGGVLIGSGAVNYPGGAQQGYSVAVSADGSVAILGGPYDNFDAGAAWVFTRDTNGNWTQQGSKLVGSGAVGTYVEQGWSVALSGDGNTALVGGPADNNYAGVAWVFTRDSNGNWTQQGALIGTEAVGSAEQGYSVALSGDGNTALVGSPNFYPAGAAWVFTRDSNGNWTQQGSALIGTGAVGSAEQGYSVALSGDGNTAIIGGPEDNSPPAGAAWVFTRDSSGNWTQQGSKLVGTGTVNAAEQGTSVALSGDGNTAFVGGPADNSGLGAVWVFTRDISANWIQEGAKLVGSGASGNVQEGLSVSLSTDGNTVLVGGENSNAWLFTNLGGTWDQQGNMLSGPSGGPSAAALSGDGSTAIIGGPYYNDADGGVSVFVDVPTLSSTTLSFGAVNVGFPSAAQSVTLSNGNPALSISNIGITGTNAADFLISNACSTTLPAASSCAVLVTFTPSAIGLETASLSFTDSAYGSPQTVTLNGIGTAATAVASPTSLNFGTQNTGTASAGQTVTLSNSGNIPLAIGSINLAGANATDFTITNGCGSALAAASSCTVSVTFTPLAIGARTASLGFTDSAYNGSPQTVSLSGMGAAAIATLSPSNLNFGSVNVGVTTASQTITLLNSGNIALAITGINLTGTNAADFAISSNTCGAILPAASSCTVSAIFIPLAIGTRTASISFTDSANGSSQVVALSGTGTASTATLTPSFLNFGSVNIGATGAAQNVNLSNIGNIDLSITSITVAGTNAADFAITSDTCGTTLTATSNCTVSVTFTPSAVGARNAFLSFADSASGSPQTAALSAVGSAATATVSPNSLNFGIVKLRATSAAQSIALSNSGNIPLSITSIALAGTNAADYAISSNTCGSALAAGGSCTVSVTFTPLAIGVRTASLSFTDLATGSPETAILAGTGKATRASSFSPVPGALSHIAVGADGSVWGINSSQQIFTYDYAENGWTSIPGALTQIAVGSSTAVWGLNAQGQIYHWDSVQLKWLDIPGTLMQIAVGADGDAWGLNYQSNIYHYNPQTGTFSQVPGTLIQIAVGSAGAVYGVNGGGAIFWYNPGTSSFQHVANTIGFNNISVGVDGDVWAIQDGVACHYSVVQNSMEPTTGGSFSQLAAGSGATVFALDASGGVWQWDTASQIWIQADAILSSIAVGADGTVWGLNSSQEVFELLNALAFAYQTLTPAAGSLSSISVGADGSIWGLTGSAVEYFDRGTQNFQPASLGTPALAQISVGTGADVWGVDPFGNIFQYNPSSQTWNNIPGELNFVQVGADGSVWGINAADLTFTYDFVNSGWINIPGTLQTLSVGADGTVWGINAQQRIYRFDAATQSWVNVPGSLVQISVGNATNIWGVNAEQQVYRYDTSPQKWVIIPGAYLVDISVAFDGSVWGVDAAGGLYQWNSSTQTFNFAGHGINKVFVGNGAAVWALNTDSGAVFSWF